MLDKSKTYSLALSGGGFKGAYQAGAIKALYDEGIKINAIVGTSIGSLNGAMATCNNMDGLEKLWHNFKISDVFLVEDSLIESIAKLDFANISLKEVAKQLKTIIKDKGLDISPLKKLIDDNIDEDKLRNSEIDFGLVTVSLTDMKAFELMLEDIPEGRINDFLLASCYLPAFKSEKLHGKRYLDGGFANNVPSSMLTDRGYRDIIEIRLNKYDIIQQPSPEADIKLIATEEDLGGALTYDLAKINYNYDLGYFDGLRLVRGLKGNKYYLEIEHNEVFAINKFLRFKKTKVQEILSSNVLERIIGDNEELSKERLIFEKFIPYIANELKLKKTYTYMDVYISLLEKVLEYYNIERFKIYDEASLIEILKEKYKVSNKLPQNNLIAMTLATIIS